MIPAASALLLDAVDDPGERLVAALALEIVVVGRSALSFELSFKVEAVQPGTFYPIVSSCFSSPVSLTSFSGWPKIARPYQRRGRLKVRDSAISIGKR